MEIERFVTDQATYQLARMVLGWALINMKNSRPLPFGSRGATFWNYTQGGEPDSCDLRTQPECPTAGQQ
jgi:hypothetical protein